MSNEQNNNVTKQNKQQQESKKEDTKMSEVTKKQFTINELSSLTNIPSGTIRTWIMKPIPGKIYETGQINYQNLQSKLIEYFGDKLKILLGCKAIDVEIIKGERTSEKKWLKVKDLTINQEIVLRNYSLKTELTYVGTTKHEQTTIYLFKGIKGYKAYTLDELEQENIKLESK